MLSYKIKEYFNKGYTMKYKLFGSLLIYALFSTTLMAEEPEIKLIDESSESTLFQNQKIQGTIVGCNDHLLKKEMNCAKKPKDAILSQLPTSQQIKDTNLKNNDESKEIKIQLANILTELNMLKKAQTEDRKTIQKLHSIIQKLTTKNASNKNIQKEIQDLRPKKSQSPFSTLIKKQLKEISRTESSVVVEVQKNESLSTYAEAYYGDNRKYYKIYKANKNIIPPSLTIVIGDRLTIPLD